MFYFFKHFPDYRTISTLIRFYSIARKSHYEVLKLRKNCTDKEIKEAFIKMSKQFHPDKNKDVNAQKQFVKIVEAYHVLGKPSSRAQYDNTTEFETSSPRSYRSYESYKRGRTYDYYTHNTQNQRTHQNSQKETSYYGVAGLKRVPNYVITIVCFAIAFFGTIIQVVVIRELYVVHQKQALERSRYLADELDKVRAAARQNDNEMQTRILLEKIVTSSNPTIATASLGQALASEKK